MAAALTQLSGGSGADGLKAGALGAMTASAMSGYLVKALYGKDDPGSLSGDEKRLVSSLMTIAGGMMGYAVTGGDVSMASVGAGTAKVEVENNSLSDKDKKLPIIDIRPGWLKPGVIDEDGDLSLAGGGIGKGRPSHKQSEKDVGKDLGAGWKEQVSYKDGKEVPYGTKGSTRPDWCNSSTCSIEVKNYNIASNHNGLISNVAKQAIDRQANLPAGMKQEIVIDVRGQTITPIQRVKIVQGIVDKSNGTVDKSSIRFKTND